jgi:RES domain-containing protein
LKIYRFTKRKYARPVSNALSGEGARITGGRWNVPGYRAVYTSAHISLAILEILVHAGEPEDLEDWVVIPLELVDKQVERLAAEKLPKDWRSKLELSQHLGTKWLTSGSSLALEVPSVIVPDESNILLNPLHADFESMKLGDPKHYLLDSRLWKA